ncbi:hydantoinase B/oxoprolinase family protein [Pseudooceanicola sediminis]|uniref:Hydantoinase B/oxoprolinase family protein n=1 Tax=Pseudooceanicola sediminis TaxID=2211117 RepID=A0A399J4X2_9RHOB|nr:hydantoinase B/oxoprolinase family protein [Pseudooceanicola sediminis]KAA2317283.1 hydantoinase B/oxoprolinase family protein [Puniceibacterium sp. HSS470]RII39637.1 hydantoinase B/oxoprolinase family protein [Pseudooceanicola sediminis]|tara:strand:- start:13679 stop:15226 length:1548 start_codon:yes stop_codon:yes gene_type:complete
MDGVELQILWSNLIGIVSEQARALQRIAFSPIVREAGDLANGLFDEQARMVAQAVTGTPGHINSLAAAARNLLDNCDADSLQPGDVLITNDPWMSAGHFFDITILSPIFRGERIIGYAGSTIHHSDIGGYGIGSGARDIHEEGLWIPTMKLYEAGKPNETLFQIIRRNVRTPDALMGDLGAQVSSGIIASDRLNALCDRYGLDDISELSQEIITRSETATRDAIRKLPGGTYHGASRFDVPGGQVIDLKTAVTVDAEKGEIVIDFEGSSPPSSMGINVVPAYTHAYATFAVRSSLNPDLPNNAGSLAPIRLKLPDECVVNAKYPSPVNARHVVGMYVPFPILKALAQVIPDRVVAEGSGAVWTIQISGKDRAGVPFTSSMFNYSGGMGARATKPGISAVCYPTGVSAVPVEVLEATYPIAFTCKELEHGTGGAGKYPGGDGQRIGYHMRTGRTWLLNTIPSRLVSGPEGLLGGGDGAAGVFQINGEAIADTRKREMQPDDEVFMITPGGGGYGAV